MSRRAFVLARALSALSLLTAFFFTLAGPAGAACHIAKFSTLKYEAPETAASVTIVIERVPSGCTGKLKYETRDESARAGADYVATTGELDFGTTDEEKSFEIPLRDDSAAEGNETFSVRVSKVSGNIDSISQDATVTILENDAAPPPPAPPAPASPTARAPAPPSPSPSPPPPPPSPSPSPSPTPSPTPTARAAAEDGGGPPLGLIIGLVALFVAGGAGVALWYMRKGQASEVVE